MKNNKQIQESFNNHVMGTYGRFPIAIVKGENCKATDADGKEYIDFGSGIGTNSLGYCDSSWVEAVTNQASTLQHISNYYYHPNCGKVADILCTKTGLDKMFFGNSGAEANECAIKIARKYSFDKYGADRNKILTLVNSFHGRTVTTLSATGQDEYHNYFFPFTQGFDFVVANDISDLNSKVDDTVCGIVVEFVQGEGGVVPLDKEFVLEIEKICKQKDILFIADEVQTGIGRTGSLYCYEQFGVKPDVVSTAKGLAGGLPIGGCLCSEKLANVLVPGTHGSTFGGNPISCAGAIAVLEKVANDDFLAEVVKKGEYFKAKLEAINEVECVVGMGLMLGAKLKTKLAKDVIKECLESGLLILTAKQNLRFLPPLTITYEEIDEGFKILEAILNK